ncbi:unnamed protein product [Ceutorhynchus assimilis]|uniref:UDP-glucuronosyltransferase n=1 Tax=Ceutorhynchus assimilis TaxID=467358 RepID=A0A9N9QNM3_9CUCU|nr:unnamed protein product [Ceutorhynchus assimilis]
MLKIIVILVTLVVFTHQAKILFLTCTPAPSHQKPFREVWKALSLRGHEVHVLTPNPLNDPELKNLTEYDLSEYYELLKRHSVQNQKFILQKSTFLIAFLKDIFATKIWSGLYNRTLNHEALKQITTNHKHFDVVIVEWLFPTLAALGAYYKAPIVGITSLGAPTVALDSLGNPSHPLVAPDMNLPLRAQNLPFKERLLSGLYSIYVRLHYHLVVLPREDANIKKHLQKDLPYIGDIEKNISLLLMNRNPVFHRIMPLLPNTIDLGGIKTALIIETMEPALKKFLDESKEGVIYFSLGSSMKSVFLDEDIVALLRKVFESLPYKVIWKWEEVDMEGKPQNVFIGQWIPQISILAHPNVKLFITQGGLQSIEEAIAAHKPIIGIPFHSDQTTNVDTCVKYGMGKMMDLEDLSEVTLKNNILEIVNNPSYAENARKLDELMKDQPQDGLEKAIWWIEYVIRHKGARHLRSIAVDLPLWQYLMLDVFAFVFTVIFGFIFSVYVLAKLILRVAFGRSKKIKAE